LRIPGQGAGVFWQKRYYDRNVRDEREFVNKLRYIHRNRGVPSEPGFGLLGWKPVKRGLVLEPGDWKWSTFRHYSLREKGVIEIES
jgi:putative transposase